MDSGRIEVNTAHLDAGSELSRAAASSVRDAAQQLANATVEAGIFGNFDAAHQFHGAFSAAHEHHRAALHARATSLDAVSSNATTAAEAFTATDESEGRNINAAGDALS